MDDIPASVDSEEKGMKVMSEIESVLEKRGFKMKHWTFSGQKSKREKSVDQTAVQTLLKKRDRK